MQNRSNNEKNGISVMLNSQTNCRLKVIKKDQHTRGRLVIDGTKHHKDNHLQSLELLVEWPNWEYKFISTRAHWSKMEDDASTFVGSFLESLSESSVDENCEKIKDQLTTSMATHIPSQITRQKQHQNGSLMTSRKWPQRSTGCAGKPGGVVTPSTRQPFGEY